MIQKQGQYKRAHPRVNFDWPVIVLSEQGTLQGKIKDISRGGALILVNTKIEAGEAIRMAIEIAEYDDVISVKGEVVRAVSIDELHDGQRYGLGVRFTEISEEDLRYFTGNLAPEWQDGYEEPEIPVQVKTNFDLWKISSAVLAGCLILAVALFLLPEKDDKESAIAPDQLASISNKVADLEEQTSGLSPQQENIDLLEEKILLLEEKITELETKFVEYSNRIPSRIEPLQIVEEKQADKPIQEDVGLLLPKKKKISLNITGQQTVSGYHFVQRGDTLYRISQKYGLTVDQLLRLNNLSPQAKIHPNQKLLVTDQPDKE